MISVCWPAAEFVVTALVGGSKPNGVSFSGKILILSRYIGFLYHDYVVNV